jgi:hypothetical protein
VRRQRVEQRCSLSNSSGRSGHAVPANRLQEPADGFNSVSPTVYQTLIASLLHKYASGRLKEV